MDTYNMEFIWLWISSFGVVFAILSWLNDMNIFVNKPPYKKGLLAVILGSGLFILLPFKLIQRHPQNDENEDLSIL